MDITKWIEPNFLIGSIPVFLKIYKKINLGKNKRDKELIERINLYKENILIPYKKIVGNKIIYNSEHNNQTLIREFDQNGEKLNEDYVPEYIHKLYYENKYKKLNVVLLADYVRLVRGEWTYYDGETRTNKFFKTIYTILFFISYLLTVISLIVIVSLFIKNKYYNNLNAFFHDKSSIITLFFLCLIVFVFSSYLLRTISKIDPTEYYRFKKLDDIIKRREKYCYNFFPDLKNSQDNDKN